jgi:mono/diheme cytochrome c family protein
MNRRRRALWAALALVALAACRQDMHDQPRLEPMELSDFFDDGRASRPPVAGAVARGDLREDGHFYTGYVNGELAAEFPFTVNKDVVVRGRERFEIYCAPCHGRVGDGRGVVVQRGFRQPPSYHIDRLREAPAGHFFEVISHGYGHMYSFNDRVKPRDRWAIAAYIRALQLSQAAALDELPASLITELRAEGIQ